MKTKMKVVNKETKEETIVDYMVDRDECNRPDTTLEGLAKLDAGAGARASSSPPATPRSSPTAPPPWC